MSVSSGQCGRASATGSRWVVGEVAIMRWELWVGKAGVESGKEKDLPLPYPLLVKMCIGSIGSVGAMGSLGI